MSEQQNDLTTPEAFQASQQVYERQIVAREPGSVTADLNAVHGREG